MKILFAFLFSVVSVFGQSDLSYFLPANTLINSSIDTPEKFLGYQVGAQHASPYEILQYAKYLSRVSDRIKLDTYGRTFENRELVLLTISSPANLSNLKSIKEEHSQLLIPDAKLDFKKMKGVVWMGYSVHGNEASGTNSSLLSMYYLAAAQGTSIDSLLNENIILIDPCINPDGGNRFSTWVNQNKSKNLVSDPNSREFKETWPAGRTNHYWFDLNRDWLYQQLPESKGRLKAFYDWMPNILTDHHEMGSNSSFFFQPGVPSRTHPLTPDKNITLTSKIGNFHAAGLDAIGSYYYTKENYDDFYYGKGSTLPDVNGSIGILFEQASSRGHLQETVNGKLSFPFTIKNQFSATLSTLKAAKNMREELLKYMSEFFSEKIPAEAPKAYIFGSSADKVANVEMVNILLRNKIEVYPMSKDETINGKKFLAVESFIAPLSQPKHRLLRSFFEQRTTFKDSAFYDISAWTLPLCMNVPFSELKTIPPIGSKIENEMTYPIGSVDLKGRYAYAFTWKGYFAPRTALKLINAGYKLKVATQPFELGAKFDYGTVQFMGKGKETEDLLQKISQEDGTEFIGLSTGLSTTGLNLGSEKFKNIELPKPLMIVGDGIDANDAGEIWHLLDQRYNMELSMADQNQVNRIDLYQYTHIIMPSGRYSELNEEKIKGFLAKGGTLVSFGDANQWLSNKKISSVNLKPAASAYGKERKSFDTKQAITGALETSGAILETQIDLSHPLCFGYNGSTLPLFKVNNTVFEDTGNPFNMPLVFTAKPLMAGYVHPKNMERFKSSPAVISTTVGLGKIAAFSDNPNFRAFWYGTNKLFANALFFSNMFN